ncbi:MAG: DUF4956 domain-containing protein [Oscillospiraceae bacterium]
MKELLFNYFQEQAKAITFEKILLNFGISLLLALVIYVSYRFSHSGPVYSARFNVSLVMLTLVTTLVMTVIGNNIALSLGMVGALSIVRFRTAIKDPRDTAYIFWCIAVGICCGVSEHLIAATGSSVIFLFLLIFGRIQKNDRYLLIVRGDRSADAQVTDAIKIHFLGKAVLRVTNLTKDSSEMIFEVSEKMLKSSRQGVSITDKLCEFEGVSSVNLVCQNDEINR